MSVQILGFIVNAVSLVAIPFAINELKIISIPDNIRPIVVAISACGVFAIFISCVIEYVQKRNGRTYKRSDDITKAMIEIIRKDGNTVIVSRNMSWAENDEVISELDKKSKSNDLKIYLQSNQQKLSSMHNYAEVVKKYNNRFTPSCRFTINSVGRHGERLYIAVTGENKHSIYNYTAEDGPIFYLAKDLVQLLEVS